MALSLPVPRKLADPEDVRDTRWDLTPIHVRQDKQDRIVSDFLLVHDEFGAKRNGWPVVFKIRGIVDPDYLRSDGLDSNDGYYTIYLGPGSKEHDRQTMDRFMDELSFPRYQDIQPSLQGFVMHNRDDRRLCFCIPVEVSIRNNLVLI